MCWICEKLIDVGSKVLELLKQKDAYLHESMNSFKRFSEKKITVLLKVEQLVIMVKN